MPQSESQSSSKTPVGKTEAEVAGPRAILRVPEVLMALAARRGGGSLAQLAVQLQVPKTSLHRLMRTLERSGYLAHQSGVYMLGPESFHLASLIGKAAQSTSFPASARPVLEGLARETQETVMLGVLSDCQSEIQYVDVIDSESPVRFTVPVGDRRPLYSAASGKAALAFLPPDARQAYLDRADFTPFTPLTTGKEELPGLLRGIRDRAVAFDLGGKVVGASGAASPFFGSDGRVLGSVSVAGPAERMQANRARLEAQVRQAGQSISRILGYSGDYPPAS